MMDNPVLNKKKFTVTALAVQALVLAGCAAQGPVEGPDKQFAGSLSGAVTAAGSGAVTGFQVSAGAGPGALVGAGVGAIAGGINGFAKDQTEERQIALAAELEDQKKVAYAQEVLSQHYKRRAELHPTRDIFPADLFFYGDQASIREQAQPLVRELARLNKLRLPYSRIVIASYVKSVNPVSAYAQQLANRRARALGDCLVRYGIEPRRIDAHGVVVDAPVLIDPKDRPQRYNQAIELIAPD